MKFHATIQLHFEARDVDDAREKFGHLVNRVHSRDVDVCQSGFSEEKEEDGESGKSDH